MVKVPLAGIGNGGISAAGPAGSNALKLFTADTLRFNQAYPPMLFFMAYNNAAPGDSIKALLMNFFADDPAKENGQNNVWTGKLVEWNMASK